jgi:heat shock protein HtpX
MNLLEQQASNRRRTWIIIGGFMAFLFFLGLGFDAFYIGGAGGSVPIGSIAALGIGSVSALASYYAGDRAVLLATRAVPIGQMAPASDDERLRLRQLENVVDEMAIAAGLPRPAVYIVPDDDPNAFATGRGPEHSSIAVTRGLLNALDREELQGVIAHEMSHVRNYDVRLMTVVAALVGATALIADWSRRGMFWGGGRRRDNDDDRGRGGAAGLVFFVLWIIAVALAPLISQVLAMMLSRRREYLADASGAELTRNPLGLARALEKIDAAVEPTQSINRGSAHLCIADPLGRQVNLKEGFWPDLLASHPPMAARIAALKQMAYQGGQL